MNLSPGAWVALGCLVGIVVFSGAVLWAAWQRGLRSPRNSPPPPSSEGPSFTRAWEKEDAQLAELSRQVNGLAHDTEKKK
jgi:hypothetical protein